MKKDNLAFNEDIQMFLQGKKEQIEIYQEMPDGYMALTYYSILPGIYLAFNDIHTTTVPVSGGLSFEHLLIVNFCLEGRCEFHLSEDNYSYIDKNHMSQHPNGSGFLLLPIRVLSGLGDLCHAGYLYRRNQTDTETVRH